MHFYQLERRKKKRDIFIEKRDGAKMHEFTPESGTVDTYASFQIQSLENAIISYNMD